MAAPATLPGADALRAGGVLLIGSSAAGRAAALERLLAGRTDAVRLAAPPVAVPLGAFLPLLDGSGAGFAPPAVLVAGRVRSRLQGTAVLAVEDVHELDPASAGLLARLAETGVRLALTAQAGARSPAAIDALVADGTVAVVELADGAPGETASAARAAVRELPTDARRVAELVVLGGRLEGAIVDLLGAAPALPALTASGLVWDAPDGSLRPAGRAAADAVRAGLPAARRRRRFAELAEARRRAPGDGLAEQVALVRWSLEAGDPVDPVDPGTLLATAELIGSADPAGVESLLRAAVAAGGGVPASLHLADHLAGTGRVEEAIELLEDLEAAPLTPDAFLAARLRHASLLALPGNRPGDALRILDDLDAESRALPAVEAVRASALTAAGRVREAHLLARTLQQGHPVLTAEAALTECRGLLHFGEVDEFERAIARARPVIRETAGVGHDGFPALRVVQLAGDVVLGGDPTGAWARARAAHREALLAGDDALRTRLAGLAGWAAALAGDLRAAEQLLREALRPVGSAAVAAVPEVRARLVRVLVAAGSADADPVLAQLRAAPRAGLADAPAALAEAAVLARSDPAAAGRLAREAGDLAAAAGQRNLAREAWHDAARFGDRVAASRLLAASQRGATVFERAVRRHAEAVLDGGPEPLAAAAEQFARAGARWHAAEVQAAAVLAHAGTADTAARAAATARLRHLSAECAGLDSPLLSMAPAPRLTAREAEAVELAASGLDDRQIAERMGVTPRTAQGHLARASAKLGGAAGAAREVG